MKPKPRDANDVLREQGADGLRDAFDKAPRKAKGRFELVPFDAIKIDTAPNYLVKGIVPRGGLIVVWGPPKCGKSFWTFDLMMHVALGWQYRGRRVQQGAVVYLALEGGSGFRARVEAWRQQHLNCKRHDPVPFYLISASIDLAKDHAALIASIRAELGDVQPDAVVIDTLNRALMGDENASEDMAKFIRAADTIRAAFDCAAVIVHHCGIQGTRPRGHTSLTGADDAQIAVDRAEDGTIVATVEHMKDGPDGGTITSRLEHVELGEDDDGDPITSCIIVAAEGAAKPQPGKLSDNDKLALEALTKALLDAGQRPPASNHIPQSGTFSVCPVEVWRGYFYAVKDGDRDIQRKAFLRARDRLQVQRIIGTWRDLAWLAGPAGHAGTSAGHVPQASGRDAAGHSFRDVPACPAALSRSAVPAFRVIGSTQPGTVCIACNSAEGDVLKIASVEPGSKSETLHEGCAAGWFETTSGE